MSTQKQSKVRLGIIGVGNMGSGHIANILAGRCPEIEVTAVADINPARLDYARSKIPEVAVFNTAEEMLDSGLIDAAIVAVPHYFHPKYVLECFKRGIHVMSEKPAGVYTKQVREMNEAAKSAGVVFGMMFNQRTDCLYRKMRELVQSGKYGNIRRTSWIITNWYRPQAYYDSGAWRATWSGEGGGVLLNQAPHNVDLWTWLAGMPLAVRAGCSEGKYHRIGVEDEATIYAEFPGGATGVFITSTGEAPGTNRLELVFDRGRLLLENGRLNVLRLGVSEREFCFTSKAGYALPDITEENIVLRPERDGHSLILEDFARTILSGTPLLSPGRDGVNELSISNAAYLSSWTGRRVELPLSPASMAEFHKLLTAKRSAEQSGAAGTRGEAANTSDIGGSEYNARWTTRW